ncbi:MAG TPA: hypothetical protein DDZ39_05175 [Flavobacteriaceae bacterium]|jgi:hypothetical protein|nr:hypothetical protein [Flavobacteriaceae bacterium]HBS12348.1 hypothetical protein [Flavobacteriaceae bacterium]
MNLFQAHISISVTTYFSSLEIVSLNSTNDAIERICGVKNFFERQSELNEINKLISKKRNSISETERAEYGDFQTNRNLSDATCNLLKQQLISPKIIIEPTCGKGNFIISSLKTFKSITHIYGIEIYKPYIWETKFAVLDFFLNNTEYCIPKIKIIHYNIFDFDFNYIAKKHQNDEFLIIGNPPWVTNSKLSVLNSNNFPKKSNFKKHKGLDAITGKGNFDIAEYISLNIFEIFSNLKGTFSFLIKNSVAKNILKEQKRKHYKISNIKQFNIDAKKEFNVSVNASLFTCTLGNKSDFSLSEHDFYTSKHIRNYGWVNDKFVFDIKQYQNTKSYEGKFSYEWRQGIKHDLSKIMELERVNGHFINNKQEIVKIENELVFGLLKSSDLKGKKVNKTRKFTIITQKKIGQETKYIRTQYPKTYKYLLNNVVLFNNRKSSIYKGKPLFSIFGIGDYSFKPYKVAISGMYKTTTFSIVLPNNKKPIMLDDTCYLIGFDSLIEAEITQFLLNKEKTQAFIRSIAFTDAKRMITKELLMRIDLNEIINNTAYKELEIGIGAISEIDWINYRENLAQKTFNRNQQLDLFETMHYPQQKI